MSPLLTAAVIFSIVATSLLPAAFAVATGALVGSLQPAIAGGIDGPAGRRLMVWAVVVGSLFALQQALAGWRSNVLAGDLGRRVTTALADRQTEAMLRPATIAHLEDPSFLDDAAKATGVGGIGPWAATTGLVQLWTSRLAGLAALGVAATYAPLAAAGLFLALVVNVTVLRRQYLQLVQTMNRRAGTLRRADYLRALAHDPAAAKEVRLFGFDGWLLHAFDESWTTAMREIWRQRRGMTLATLGAVGPLVGAFTLALWTLRSALLSGEMDAGATTAFLQGLLGSLSLASVARSDSWIVYGTATIPAQDHLDRRVRADASLVLPGEADPSDLPRREIRFEGVAFTYPGTDQPVFEALDLAIPAGQSLGIVGVNGAGKTTLVKLLCRLYDPDDGVLLVDGLDARRFDPYAWQRRLAVLFQDVVRYPLTLRDNVTLGSGDDDPQLVLDAAKRAGLDQIVEELDLGWDTIMNRQLGGVDLSGGQWQRVALARTYAAAAAGAGILVLDEPTSQLDTRAEAAFYRDFLHNTAGLTTVVISHRLAAVRQADAIAVLDGGVVAERGTHQQLMAAGGTYAELFELQASRFGEGTRHG